MVRRQFPPTATRPDVMCPGRAGRVKLRWLRHGLGEAEVAALAAAAHGFVGADLAALCEAAALAALRRAVAARRAGRPLADLQVPPRAWLRQGPLPYTTLAAC